MHVYTCIYMYLHSLIVNRKDCTCTSYMRRRWFRLNTMRLGPGHLRQLFHKEVVKVNTLFTGDAETLQLLLLLLQLSLPLLFPHSPLMLLRSDVGILIMEANANNDLMNTHTCTFVEPCVCKSRATYTLTIYIVYVNVMTV